MRTPREAIAEIVERIRPIAECEHVALAEACGRVLAQDAEADIDLPPFEKSAMDGFAVQSADFATEARRAAAAPTTSLAGERVLRVVGESKAGGPFDGTVAPGQCVAIYTGAPLPDTCDAVVIVEKSERRGADVLLRDRPTSGQHVAHKGEDLRAGARVLARGRRLSTIDVAVLAAIGCEPVRVVRRPRVALATTGDELVTPDKKPGPGEIREGNTLTLGARLVARGVELVRFGILPDDADVLRRELGRALETCDALITTGGVSMGEYDLVGGVLEELGVELVLHKVAVKPGKPIWFGTKAAVPVFGLPGNPVSSLVGLELFAVPALERMSGVVEEANGGPPRVWHGAWEGALTRASEREQYVPVRAEPRADGVVSLVPVRWRGSADIVGLAGADGWAVVPAGDVLRPGELARYHPFTVR